MGFLKETHLTTETPKRTKPAPPREDRPLSGRVTIMSPTEVRVQFHQGEIQDLATAARTWLLAYKHKKSPEIDAKRKRTQALLAKLEGMS
jgi:hypothetical protein